MSPILPTAYRGNAGFPRVSGDEPQARQANGHNPRFSPRERG